MKTKNCKNCNCFKKIYRGGYGFYYSLAYPLFYCTLSEQMAERENSCGNWQKKISECDISSERFDEAEEDIKALINLFS